MAETNLSKNKEGYGYKYTDLAQIHEYLEQNNMKYYQYIERIDNEDYVMTVKIIDGIEQKALRGCRVVNATLNGKSNPAQEQGSALTYARRYSLLMAFGLATEDDDAESLTKSKENNKTNKTTNKITSEQIKILMKTAEKYKVTDEQFKKLLSELGYEKLEAVSISDFAKVGNALGKINQ